MKVRKPSPLKTNTNQMQKSATSILILGLILLISCYQKKESGNAEQRVLIEDAASAIHTKDNLSRFQQYLSGLKTRNLPHIDRTNFDSFIDEDDLVEIDEHALKLEEIYPEIQNKNSKYYVIYAYRLTLSTNFYTAVVTVRIGAHELETTLINYDLKGKIIARLPIAYEEIAEEMTQQGSRISENKITTQLITWDLIKEIEEKEFRILPDGMIEEVSAKKLSEVIEEYPLVLSVLENLNLDPLAVKSDLIRTKALPHEINEFILLIPEIVDEEEQYIKLNSHVLLTNPHTGAITHSFFESAATNQWVSDAIELQDISLDTAPYRVSDKLRAFGIRVSYRGMSRVNPYNNETLSLFIKAGDHLKKILSNFPISTFTGEWNGDCDGEFLDTKSIFILSNEQTHGYYDLLVKRMLTQTRNQEDEDGECDSTEKISNLTTTLTFNGQEYLQSPVKQ
ncbi:hypothetical protein U3A58_18830 [Algoriphagus sp. C2-6-M1]|uniref:hypothetical protein n=1 Tax=Algoriphagus persicinus TaxID=3108754 RepID=UPI002B3D8472|nr:hypothetical protein [Algoriphagus sp. C2-6-M1]MEB2782452.1 hypothetical protein [Algoriphagus sp. C2-6-M1]